MRKPLGRLWDGFVKWFTIYACAALVCRIVIALYYYARPILVGLFALPLLILALWGLVLLRRKIRGYYIETSGNGEGGGVIYHEGENTVEIYFDRFPFIIHVPSDVAWERTMPDWAKGRKTEIMERIKKEFPRAQYQEK